MVIFRTITKGGGHIKTLQAELPDKLYEQFNILVKTEWSNDEKSVITEALRQFLEIHKPDLLEKYIGEDGMGIGWKRLSTPRFKRLSWMPALFHLSIAKKY